MEREGQKRGTGSQRVYEEIRHRKDDRERERGRDGWRGREREARWLSMSFSKHWLQTQSLILMYVFVLIVQQLTRIGGGGIKCTQIQTHTHMHIYTSTNTHTLSHTCTHTDS